MTKSEQLRALADRCEAAFIEACDAHFTFHVIERRACAAEYALILSTLRALAEKEGK